MGCRAPRHSIDLGTCASHRIMSFFDWSDMDLAGAARLWQGLAGPPSVLPAALELKQCPAQLPAGAQRLLAAPPLAHKAAPPAAAAAAHRNKSATREAAANAPASSWSIGSAAPDATVDQQRSSTPVKTEPAAEPAVPVAQQQAAFAEGPPASLAASRHPSSANEKQQEQEPASPLASDQAALLELDVVVPGLACPPTVSSSPAPACLIKRASSRRRGQPVLRQLSRTASGASALPRRARVRLADGLQRLRGRLAALTCMAPHAKAVRD